MKNLLIVLLFLPLSLLSQYAVGTMSFSYPDPAVPGRNITGDIYYPSATAGNSVAVANGQFPLIAFGHGFVIGTDDYSMWWNAIVPLGYIMILPDTEGSLSPNHAYFGADLAFLIDEYLTQGGQFSSAFFEKVANNTAVMGHSMGGGAAVLAAENNPNITTIITLAAADTSPSAIAAAANVTAPALTIASSLDNVAPPSSNQIPLHNNYASSYAAYIEITNGSHCGYSQATPFTACTAAEGFSCIGCAFIPTADQHTQMLASSIPWLDYFLKGDCTDWYQFYNYMTGSPTLHTYDENGTATGIANNLTLPGSIPFGMYQANNFINSNGVVVNSVTGANMNHVTYQAGGYICMTNGFEAPVNTNFLAHIISCP